MMPPTPVNLDQLALMPRLRPEVANALHVLMTAIRDEYGARGGDYGPQAMAVGWRFFCEEAFTDLLRHQIADEMTVEKLASDRTREEDP